MMSLEEDSILSVSGGNGKLRQWLIEQIDSRKYAGLVWETDERTIFRIPWKHAGKQDYNREEDAALFKAWALFKGKYKEGVDKPDPPTWKTRLRCALNKSNDFVELVEKSQLDISDPYKVYKTIPEGEKRGVKMSDVHETPSHVNSLSHFSPYSTLLNQVPNYVASQERYTQPEQEPLPPHHHAPHGEMQYGQCHYPSLLSRPWQGPQVENGFQISGPFYAYSTEAQSASSMVDQSAALSDCSLHVSVFYRESLVKEVTTTSPHGCRITSASSSSPSSSASSSPSSSSSSSPENELYGGAELILFPFPYPESQRQGAERLPAILERGVLLWMAHDGLYARRLCQGRVYWEGPLAPHVEKPNKLEKGQTCKLFDTQQFLTELQDYVHHGRHVPRYQVTLCFGDEYPDPQCQRKMITVKVDPMFARKLVYYYHQQTSGAYLRGYDHPEHDRCPSEEYPTQRPLLPVHD